MRLTELALRRAGAADLEEFQRREGLYPSGQEDILTMQRLTPLLLGYERYMVKPGDTYYRIATARGTSVRAMLTANPNQNPNLLIPGQYLNVPYGFTMRTSGSQHRSCCCFWSNTPMPWRRRGASSAWMPSSSGGAQRCGSCQW